MATPSGESTRHSSEDTTTKEFFSHSSAKRVNTDIVVVKALKRQYPNLELVVTLAPSCDLISFAQAGFASFEPIEDTGSELPSSVARDQYIPPSRRLDGALGQVAELLVFGKFLYKFKGDDFVVYLVDGRDGTASYPAVTNYYILTTEKRKAQSLILEAGRWADDLHEEVWVFDSGYWQKSAELFDSIRNASWDAVILDPAMKKAIIDDHLSFYRSRDTYNHLQVPWKRGLIYYGPPGNGKTISIKATMHMLHDHKPSIPTLYVRTLSSFAGPEYSIKQIFGKARQFAPCYLVFEDLDTIVSDNVRSYFLNEMDGLKSNDGVLIIGSTNHLDRLDPGIANRPSRFDRKYYFADPNKDERIAYCHFWQSKLSGNKDIDFPDKLCEAIAGITDKFSFAYMQEAFVAALLSIAQKAEFVKVGKKSLTEDLDDGWVSVLDTDGNGDVDRLILWVEIKKQVEILREGMEEKQMHDRFSGQNITQ